MNLSDFLDRPIAFYPAFVALTGGVDSAILLSQALYWSKRTKDPDGWFYKTREEWQDETSLNRTQQETARRRLRTTTFWKEERRGVPARLFYRLDLEELFIVLTSDADIPLNLESILTNQAQSLKTVSKTGYMRARKIDPDAQYVDYAAVLKHHGLICGICKTEITRPLGQKTGYLCFDHIVPFNEGGKHVFENLHPAHVNCNAVKAGKAIQTAILDPTGRQGDTPPDGASEADCTDRDKPTFLNNGSETTQGTTSENNNNPIDVVLKTNSEINAACHRLFKFWQQLFSDVPGVDTAQWKLTKERKTHIFARFRSDLKWTERQLQEALRGMRITPHNLGENETKTLYIDPTTCFRNDTRVDKYRQTWLAHERAEAEKKTTPPRKPSFSLPPNLKPANGEWSKITDSMRRQMKDHVFAQWWSPLQCLGMQHEGDLYAFFINAPNQVVKDWVLGNYVKLIEQALIDAELNPPSVELCWLIGGDYVR